VARKRYLIIRGRLQREHPKSAGKEIVKVEVSNFEETFEVNFSSLSKVEITLFWGQQ